MEKPFALNADTFALPSFVPVPGFGILHVNSYLIKAKEPVLIDTGMLIERQVFLANLKSLINPQEIRWVCLTHDDRDHSGNIMQVLEAAPKARIVTNFIGVGRMAEEWMLPLDRLLLLNPGQSFQAGDRKLVAVRPPTFDSPASCGLFDTKTSTYFCVDSFGAFLPSFSPEADAYPEAVLLEGMQTFNRALSPWTAWLDQRRFEGALADIRKLNATTLAGCHLSVAKNRTESFLKTLAALPSMGQWVAPDQAALQAMLAKMAAGGSPA